MKVLLIGGTGILSTDVCKEALKKGYEVTCLNRGNHVELQNDNAKVILGDIRNPIEITQKFKNLNYDVIVDFLSFTPKHLKDTLDIFAHKCKQFIFISSATAYSKKNENEIISEKTKLGNTNWKYGQDKVDCEKLLKKYCASISLKYTIIRPYVTYGKTRIPYAVIPNHQPWSWLNRIYSNKPVVLWNGGKVKCTLTHTTDFSKGLVGLFLNEKAMNEDFHITSDEPMTWKKATDQIVKAINHEVNIVDMSTDYIIKVLPEYKGILLGDKNTNMVFNNSKIKQAVPEFKNFTLFQDGIKKTIKYLNEHNFMHDIDIKWDARLDYLLEKYYKKNHQKYDKKKLRKFCCFDHQPTTKEKFAYFMYRYPILYYPSVFTVKVFRKIKKILNL